MNAYVSKIIKKVGAKCAGEPEFVQCVEEVLSSLSAVVDRNPAFEKADLLGRLVEPERCVSFRVSWCDDSGAAHTNTGYRCQFNGAIGPYKGGLRFHPSVYPGVIKFLGLEQTLKNSLTGLPMGGAKGGSDFDPRGRSDGEIMRFCQAFMTELYRHIGPDVDVPAGDIGVGSREIGYLYGQYRRIRGAFENSVLTGKGLSYGGSLIRPESTGYGAIYYLNEVFKHEGDSIVGKTFALSGYGNVAWGAAKKIAELGGRALTLSGSEGYIHDPDGITTKEKIDYLMSMRASGHKGALKGYAEKFGARFYPGEKPWAVRADVVLPCATQNEVNLEWAKAIVANGTKYYIEVSNMPTTNEALGYLLAQPGVIVAPSKAVNAGGVAVSGLEMCQNSMRYSWTAQEVDSKLHQIMTSIHDNSVAAAEEYGLGYNLVAGANIAGFKKVADAMMAQGAF
jgi:glutamate dehydrogenase (NADP+)